MSRSSHHAHAALLGDVRPTIAARIVRCLALLLVVGSGHRVSGQTPPVVADQEPASPATSAQVSEARLRSFFSQYCCGCHGPQRAERDLRLDALAVDYRDVANVATWTAVQRRLVAHDMPPDGEPQPAAREVEPIVNWIGEQMAAAESERRAVEGRVPLRRLNRIEYENTVCDLLGLDVDLKEILPPDSAGFGFDNTAEGQHISSFLMERYLEAAERALDLAIVNGPAPPRIKQRYLCRDERQVRNPSERVFRVLDDATVLFTSSPWQALTFWEFYPPNRGRYRFRLCVAGYQSAGKPVTFRVLAGPMLMGSKDELVGYFDAPADQPTVVEFVVQLEARSTLNLLPYGLPAAQAVDKVGADDWSGPGLAISWLDVEGPLHDEWPPASHRQLFGTLPQAPRSEANPQEHLEVRSNQPVVDAERILQAFARRALRRSVSIPDVQPFLDIVKDRLDQQDSFEQAVRVGLRAVMMVPDFLFLRERPGQLDDFALASRLSYFLWSTMPDEELLATAERGELRDPAVLSRQVERMLDHPRAARFVENFVGQWLGLRDIDVTEPSHVLYPEFDHLLKVSMVRETELFFAEVLKHDLSLLNFVASDFTMLNGRLARHYGIPDVDGWAFRRVRLPPASHRGGMLTMASVLKVTANGTTTSPVVRGAWVLDRILGAPPPRPPANVPIIEPDIRGSTTIREQLARHRADPACASCHASIDPPGFALENFDVIGGWREHYRTTGLGETVTIDGRSMAYLKGPQVDPAGELPDGQPFRDVDEFKQLLLKDPDRLARALTEKLVTYATGAPPAMADRAEITTIVEQIRESKYGLRSLVHAIVRSPLFQCK